MHSGLAACVCQPRAAVVPYLLMLIRWGVKDTFTGFPAASVRPCSISGMCRCLPTLHHATNHTRDVCHTQLHMLP